MATFSPASTIISSWWTPVRPKASGLTGFYPGFGQFQTDTYNVPIRIGSDPFAIRCGKLPGLLGMSLTMADVQGILGNQVLLDRRVGYFPGESGERSYFVFTLT
jgi:hypothetical protein